MRLPLFSLVVIAVFLAVTPTSAQQTANPEAGGGAFLLLPVGARATALGQAAVADGGSTEAIFWNPAGLAAIDQREVAVHFASTFISDNTALVGSFAAGQLGVLGFAAYLVDYGSQDVVGGPGVPVGRISPKNIELLASYSTAIGAGLSAGVNYKLIQLRQDCSGQCSAFPSVAGTTHGVDIGLQYAVAGSDALRLGFAIRHAGFKLQLRNEGQADPLPTRVQVGAIYKVLLPRLRGTEERFDARLLVDVDDEWGEYDDLDLRVGLDVGLRNLLRLRGGYAFLDSQSRGPSVGVGIRVGSIAIDLARVFFVSSNFDEPLHVSVRAIF
jgi:hypothetical protein